jgi:ATP-dependent Clp protease adapter protein ClpS
MLTARREGGGAVPQSDEREDTDVEQVSRARAEAMQHARELGRGDLAADVGLVVTELVTNAVLHGGGCTRVSVSACEGGVRVEVGDRTRIPPVMGHEVHESLTGRGIRLVAAVAARWGAEAIDGGKLIWAEVTGEPPEAPAISEEELVEMWADVMPDDVPRLRVELGNVPTDLLLEAKSHVDGLVREFDLASAGARAGVTAEVPRHLTLALRSVVDRFTDARVAIKHQALEAARLGKPTTRLTLDLPTDAAEAAGEYLRALDEVDAYSRAKRLLTLETPPQHRIFRQWYIGELIAQVRAASSGVAPPAAEPFERRLLTEIGRMAAAQRASERAAKLYAVAAALATAGTPEAVAAAVLDDGVAALGAAAGGVMLAAHEDGMAVPGTVGYDEAVVARLRAESRDAELPAAVALRTGTPVWLESQAERDKRFPELAGLESATVSLCAVPLQVQGRRLGALRFSFTEARLFDEDERQFVLALAAITAQAFARVDGLKD